jgi:hypothetical protein
MTIITFRKECFKVCSLSPIGSSTNLIFVGEMLEKLISSSVAEKHTLKKEYLPKPTFCTV